MKIVLQRVQSASVAVDGKTVGRIGPGIMVLIGVHQTDLKQQAETLARKCAELRIFPDADGKMNRSLVDAGGEALVVSQFTLYGDCRKGRRPSFIEAAEPEKGNRLYEYFITCLRRHVPRVEAGVFGAHMQVSLVNDGPVTLVIECTAENPDPESPQINRAGPAAISS